MPILQMSKLRVQESLLIIITPSTAQKSRHTHFVSGSANTFYLLPYLIIAATLCREIMTTWTVKTLS